MKQALQLALVFAVLSTLLIMVTSSISPEFSFSFKSLGVSILLSMSVLIVGGRKMLRGMPEVELSYGAAAKYLIVASFVGTILSMVLSDAMYANSEKMKQGFRDYQMSLAQSANIFGAELSGADQAAFEEQLEKIEAEIASGDIDLEKQYPFAWSNLPLSIFLGLLFALIYSLIAAIFVKEKQVA